VIRRARSGARGNEVLSGHREICSHYLRSTECECRPGSKCALVSAIFVGRLAILHLHHFSAVFGGSAGREWVLHSKLHVPAFLATHSAAVVRSFSPILLFSLPLYGGATHHLAELPNVRFGSEADIEAGASVPIVIAPAKPAKEIFVLMASPFIVRRYGPIVSRSHGPRNSFVCIGRRPLPSLLRRF
jgi:hypothetical protein